jgi:hypothetical protein
VTLAAIRSHAFASRASRPGSRRLCVGVGSGLAKTLLVVGAAALGGCGTATSTQSSSPSRPAARGVPKPPPISAKLKAQEAAIHAQVLAALHAPAPPNLKPGIPSFIPRSSLKVNRILTAAPGHPALSIGGDSIWLDLHNGRSLATVQGPYLPPGVSGTAVPQTSTTIRVTFARARGSVPLASADFSIIDLCRYRAYADIVAVAGLNALRLLGFSPLSPAGVSA